MAALISGSTAEEFPKVRSFRSTRGSAVGEAQFHSLLPGRISGWAKGHSMSSGARGSYRFDQFTLDLDRGALLGSEGEELALRPKSFLMLEYFVEHAERLIDRDELMH